jgi:UDP-GlcNAc:undecaprenyl-phosphate/decaprenyl-phosphate GlcNAc-1-phosphate transferase
LIALSLFTAYLGRLKVVTNYTPRTNAFTSLVTDLAYRRRIFEILLDLLLIGVSYYLAYWTRYGLNMTVFSMQLFLRSWPVALGLAYAAFFAWRVYRGVWRYVGVNDWLRYGAASLSAGILTALVLRLADPSAAYPLEVFVLFAMYLLLGLAASRLSFQVFDQIYHRRQASNGGDGVLLYGAGDVGEIALRWMNRSPKIGYRPIGFLDDDPRHWGGHIHGVEVLGGCDQIPGILTTRKVAGIILTEPVTDEATLTRLLGLAREHGLWVRLLHLEFELLADGIPNAADAPPR